MLINYILFVHFFFAAVNNTGSLLTLLQHTYNVCVASCFPAPLATVHNQTAIGKLYGRREILKFPILNTICFFYFEFRNSEHHQTFYVARLQ